MNSLRRSVLLVSAIASCVVLPLRAAETFTFVEPTEVCFGKSSAVPLPTWARNTTIYEVNVRQYSKDSSFAAVEADLPRIRDLGVGTLWFMPIHPIGEKNRKGPLGSYYAARDYLAVNPEFGTAEDFRRLVKKAHGLGLRVILDWVANHTAWDHVWMQQHPEYFWRDRDGQPVPPLGFDWTDVVQLDYRNRDVWRAQIDTLSFWVREFDVDGFRFDYATGVPTAFWNEMSEKMRALRPDIFLLAEAQVPQHQLRAFHASYSFDMMHAYNAIAQGREAASHIDDVLAQYRVQFPGGSVFMHYTTNHDENSWQGTVGERLGGGVRAFAVVSFMLDGIPLIYNGEEAGQDKRLKFFERDPIVWQAHPLAPFYRTLTGLRRDHPALATGATFVRVPTTKNTAVYALVREAGGRKVAAFANLTARDVKCDAAHDLLAGRWQEAFSGEKVTSAGALNLDLRSWEYRVFVSQP
jgi:glycosidase